MGLFCSDCEFGKRCITNKMDAAGSKRKADMMIVGDAPSATDDQESEPFAGDHGMKLRFLMKKAGVKWSRAVKTYAIKCKPGSPSWIKKPHIQACQKHLMKDIIKYRPKVILAAGKAAIESLLNEKSVRDFRGHFYDIEINTGDEVIRTWVIPTYGMGACLTNWAFDKQVIHDFRKAKNFADTGKLPKKLTVDTMIVDSLKKLEEAREELLSAKRLTSDLETTHLLFWKADIVMMGFCPKPGRAIVFPFFKYDIDEHGKKWDQENKDYAKKLNNFVGKYKEKIRDVVAEIVGSDIPKDGFNFKYDEKIFRRYRMPVKKWTDDPIICHSLVDENLPHSLAFVLEWYGINHLSEHGYGPYDHDLWPYVNKEKKSKKPYSYAPPLLLANYLGKDVDGARRALPILKKEVKQENLWWLYKKQQMPLVRLLARFEYTGVKCSTTELQKIAKRFNTELAKIEKKLRNMVGDQSFNPKSAKQVLDFLEKIEAPLEKESKKSKKTGDYSTDNTTLENLAKYKRKKWGKFARLMIEHREITKLKGTYLDGKDGTGGLVGHIDRMGRVHTNYNAHTPRTGRLSSDDPNLQNIPRPSIRYPWATIRRCFHPTKENWLMWSIDYKQLEMRIAAYLSKDPTMIREIRKEVDMHTRNCIMFNEVLDFLPQDKEWSEKKFNKVRNYKKPKNFEKLKGKEREEVEVAVQMAAEFDEHRTFSKSLGFGVNYGMEALTLAKSFGKDVDEVQECFDLYFEKYDRFAEWRERQCELWLERGYLILPWTGRKRRFYGASEWFNSKYSQEIAKRDWDIANVNRQAMNFPIQGFANEVFTRGKIDFCNELKKQKLKSRVLLSNHDGILGEGPPEDFDELKNIASETMEFTLGKGKKNEVHLGVDFDAYKVWSGEKVEVS